MFLLPWPQPQSNSGPGSLAAFEALKTSCWPAEVGNATTSLFKRKHIKQCWTDPIPGIFNRTYKWIMTDTLSKRCLFCWSVSLNCLHAGCRSMTFHLVVLSASWLDWFLYQGVRNQIPAAAEMQPVNIKRCCANVWIDQIIMTVTANWLRWRS